MALARWDATIVDLAGNVVPNAQVTVRRETPGTPLAVLYQDRDGLTPLGNPFTAAPDGAVGFHVIGGAYRITASSGGFSRTWRYVGIGLAGEQDSADPGVQYLFDIGIADADPGAGNFRFNNADPALATFLYLSNVGASGLDISAWLDALDDGGAGTDRGQLIVQSAGSSLFIARISGAVVAATGYRKVPVTVIATTAAGFFAAGQRFGIGYGRAGVDPPAASETVEGKIEHATVAEVRAAAVGNLAVTAAKIESAAAAVALTDAATIALDWDAGINFEVTLTANRVLGNPTNGQPGTWRTVYVLGNDATDRTLTFGNQYLGELPTLTDIDNARAYLLTIFCRTATHFVVSAKRALG